MAHANDALNGIRKLIASAVDMLEMAFFIFGDAMVQLRQHGYTWDSARARILEWQPNVQARTGLSLSASWLRAAHDAAELFHKDGGLASPDGKHRVNRAEFLTLPMSDKQRARVVELLKLSLNLPKGLKRLRVSDIREAVNAQDKVKAMSKLMATVDEVERDLQLATQGDPVDLAHHAWLQAQDKALKAYNNFLKAREAEAAAEAEYRNLAELRKQSSETPAPAATVSAAKPKRRAAAPAQRASNASA